MKLTHLLTTLTALSLAVVLGACSSSSATAAKKDGTVKIGILQLINQSALNDARKGFEEELAANGYKGSKIKIDYVNAQGDQSNLQSMSQRLAADKNDLNLAIATPAAQALAKADSKTPLLFTAITDPTSAGLVTDTKAPDKNATGVTDMVDVKGQIDFTHKLFPKAKKIGLLYNAAEQNSVFQIKLAEVEIKKLGLTAVVKTAATTNDVQQATEALAAQADAIYIPTDNNAAAAMPTIGKISQKLAVPVINADATMIPIAGVATQGINYEDLGRQTAKMAIKILKGKKVSELPVEAPAKVRLVTNKTRMAQFNLTEADVTAAAK
ncbi:ABC transporter substrate-binding protein [Lacticaseibacillus mingshuiensis]|uniref:ABC transporter substrate binding protein n=1 Tax=Lacticaseibacillus mingshuiensis TaxID=2799574 RepID=A0ABW4CJP2_9LACO|nr:ABC transporter substrate-binding protein [Lacticaseibacillus mingshuiensis]